MIPLTSDIFSLKKHTFYFLMRFMLNLLQYHGGIVFDKVVNKPHLLANTVLSSMVIKLFSGLKYLYKMLPVT